MKAKEFFNEHGYKEPKVGETTTVGYGSMSIAAAIRLAEKYHTSHVMGEMILIKQQILK